jgi:hypothetical protein
MVPLLALTAVFSVSIPVGRPRTIALAHGVLGVNTLLPLSPLTLLLVDPELADFTIALAHGETIRLARPAELVLLERVGASMVPFAPVDVELAKLG